MPTLALALGLGGCVTNAIPRYDPEPTPATRAALAASGAVNGVGVGPFAEPIGFVRVCRGLGPIDPPDDLSYAGYVRQALVSELTAAGAYRDAGASPPPLVTLTGSVDSLAFSSWQGWWNITLTLTSSNGRHLTMVERYFFEGPLGGITGCRLTGQAFAPAVRELVRKAVQDPGFSPLLRPAPP